MSVHFSSKEQTWETPDNVIEYVKKMWGEPALDLACSLENRKAPHAITAKMDLFKINPVLMNMKNVGDDDQIWWMNPEYGRKMPDFIRRAHELSVECQKRVVCLIPARTDTKIWGEVIVPYAKEIQFILGRIKFKNPTTGEATNSAPFPSCFVVFDPRCESIYTTSNHLRRRGGPYIWWGRIE